MKIKREKKEKGEKREEKEEEGNDVSREEKIINMKQMGNEKRKEIQEKYKKDFLIFRHWKIVFIFH